MDILSRPLRRAAFFRVMPRIDAGIIVSMKWQPLRDAAGRPTYEAVPFFGLSVMQNFPPRRELDLARSLELFMVMAEDHRRELGLTRHELTSLAEAAEEFEDALAQQTMLETMMKNAIERKRRARRTLEKALRPVKKGMREHLTEATDLLAEVGLQPECGRRRSSPPLSTPSHVAAERSGLTTIQVCWDGGTNHAGITYIIECSYGADWHLVGATTRRQFQHEFMGDAPAQYRVIAAHKGRSSHPSEAAVLRPMLRAA